MEYIRLMRPKHYIKNILVFMPLFFSGEFFNKAKFWCCLMAFIEFCIAASLIYIINDINDIESDKCNSSKKNRPLASGKITIVNAKKLFVLLIVLLALFSFLAKLSLIADGILLLYIFLNLLYSLGGIKNIPIWDVMFLAFGFLLRIYLGGVVTSVEISIWLYLVTLCGALFMGFGKRRNEWTANVGMSRKVLKKYSYKFLDKSMYSCMVLMIVFFSLWVKEKVDITKNNIYYLLIFMAILISFKYSFNVETEMSDGDPTNVILGDKIILTLVTVAVVFMGAGIYLFH